MRALLHEFALDLRARKHDIIAAVLVFAIGIYVGGSSDYLQVWMKGQVESIGKLAGILDQMPYPQFMFFLFIFLNNSIKALMFIFLGAVFGLFPLISLLLNGMILGYLAASTAANGGDLAQLIIQGILPHGIIELPAILLASAYGIRLGVLVSKGMFSLVFPPLRVKMPGEFAHFFRMTLPLMLVLVVSLFVAAVIESTVTYHLMGR